MTIYLTTVPPMAQFNGLCLTFGTIERFTGCKTIFLKTFGNLYVFNFMEICTLQTIDKGKGSHYEKRGERWYHIVT